MNAAPMKGLELAIAQAVDRLEHVAYADAFWRGAVSALAVVGVIAVTYLFATRSRS